MSKERLTRLNEVGFVWRVLLTGPVAYRPKAPRHTPEEKAPLASRGAVHCETVCWVRRSSAKGGGVVQFLMGECAPCPLRVKSGRRIRLA